MSMDQFMKALTMLPQIAESIKSMSDEEKHGFIERLGLEGEEKETAYEILRCFQEGKSMQLEQQKTAYQILEKALQMNQLDLSTIFKMQC